MPARCASVVIDRLFFFGCAFVMSIALIKSVHSTESLDPNETPKHCLVSFVSEETKQTMVNKRASAFNKQKDKRGSLALNDLEHFLLSQSR